MMDQESSLSSQVDSNDRKKKKNRPKNTRLRQQKLPAWKPILTAYTVIPVFFGIGIVFLPIGFGLFLASKSLTEFELPYTDCSVINSGKWNSQMAAEVLKRSFSRQLHLKCQYNITLSDLFQGNVYFYYGLSNFYQNHRRYVKSRSDSQLLGDVFNVDDCDPYSRVNQSDPKSRVIAPCGAIANSMFNDSFQLEFLGNDSGVSLMTPLVVPFTHRDLVWSSDRTSKFRNPKLGKDGDLCSAFGKTEKPPNWSLKPCELDLQDATNNGFENADFIIWMRTAALPNFRKLYRRLDRSTGKEFSNGLPQGQYRLTIEYNYPVLSFNGEKRFIISTTSIFGTKNAFLGIAYLIVGLISVILGIIFSGIHFKYGKSAVEFDSGYEEGSNAM